MTDPDKARKHIKEGKLDEAVRYLSNCIAVAATTPGADQSELYYLLGNAYRKKGEFHKAMDCYTRAMDENPETPASEARKVLQEIMSFHNKDMYNH